MLQRIITRNGTGEEWEEANPVLLLGELGLEINEGEAIKAKVGDGATAWLDLDYSFEGGGGGGEDQFAALGIEVVSFSNDGVIRFKKGSAYFNVIGSIE